MRVPICNTQIQTSTFLASMFSPPLRRQDHPARTTQNLNRQERRRKSSHIANPADICAQISYYKSQISMRKSGCSSGPTFYTFWLRQLSHELQQTRAVAYQKIKLQILRNMEELQRQMSRYAEKFVIYDRGRFPDEVLGAVSFVSLGTFQGSFRHFAL